MVSHWVGADEAHFGIVVVGICIDGWRAGELAEDARGDIVSPRSGSRGGHVLGGWFRGYRQRAVGIVTASSSSPSLTSASVLSSP